MTVEVEICQVEKTLSIALNKVGKVRLMLRQLALLATAPSLSKWYWRRVTKFSVGNPLSNRSENTRFRS